MQRRGSSVNRSGGKNETEEETVINSLPHRRAIDATDYFRRADSAPLSADGRTGHLRMGERLPAIAVS
jgi:hypothetical protein